MIGDIKTPDENLLENIEIITIYRSYSRCHDGFGGEDICLEGYSLNEEDAIFYAQKNSHIFEGENRGYIYPIEVIKIKLNGIDVYAPIDKLISELNEPKETFIKKERLLNSIQEKNESLKECLKNLN